MNHVQTWAEHRQETLRSCLGEPVAGRDLNDDRLAEVLHALSDDEQWRAFEHALSGQLLRVYDLDVGCVRLDSTTASSYASERKRACCSLVTAKIIGRICRN